MAAAGARAPPLLRSLLPALLIVAALLGSAAAAAAAPAASSAPARGRAATSACPAPRAAPPPPPPPPALPLRTRGRDIVDAAGARARLRCASWSGGQEAWGVPSGLWARPARDIAATALAAGLNCVRLVWSVEGVLRAANGSAAVPAEAVAADTGLAGKGPLQVMDAVVEAVTAEVCGQRWLAWPGVWDSRRCRVGFGLPARARGLAPSLASRGLATEPITRLLPPPLHPQGMLVILDNHSSDAMWCCSTRVR
jgi:hypothetical protein